jgi:hypothetical protein
MLCPRGSIASVTTDCWPAPLARPTSLTLRSRSLRPSVDRSVNGNVATRTSPPVLRPPLPAMPLLRRPHNHCRELRVRPRTSRSAVTPSQQRHRDVMTPVPTSSHRPLAGKPRFQRCIAVATPPPTAHAEPSIRPNSPRLSASQRQTRHWDRRSTANYAGQRIRLSRRFVKSPKTAPARTAARGFLPGRPSDVGPQSTRE